jgi:hypothetical protein
MTKCLHKIVEATFHLRRHVPRCKVCQKKEVKFYFVSAAYLQRVKPTAKLPHFANLLRSSPDATSTGLQTTGLTTTGLTTTGLTTTVLTTTGLMIRDLTSVAWKARSLIRVTQFLDWIYVLHILQYSLYVIYPKIYRGNWGIRFRKS